MRGESRRPRLLVDKGKSFCRRSYKTISPYSSTKINFSRKTLADTYGRFTLFTFFRFAGVNRQLRRTQRTSQRETDRDCHISPYKDGTLKGRSVSLSWGLTKGLTRLQRPIGPSLRNPLLSGNGLYNRDTGGQTIDK